MLSTTRLPITLALLVGLWLHAPAHGLDKPWPGPYVENDDLLVVLMPHTPESMAAFYEARGFPQVAIDLISTTCFITVHVENRSREVIWMDVAQWQFTTAGKPLARLDRAWWESRWDSIDLRQASRSTFGWTQLPQVRDLQPDEPVGGNLVFPGDTGLLDMTLNLPIGENRHGRLISLQFKDIPCPQVVTTE